MAVKEDFREAQPEELNDVAQFVADGISYGAFKDEKHFMEKLKNVLLENHWVKNSPGWRAVFNPSTLLDKSFQIHTLNWHVEYTKSVFNKRLKSEKEYSEKTGKTFDEEKFKKDFFVKSPFAPYQTMYHKMWIAGMDSAVDKAEKFLIHHVPEFRKMKEEKDKGINGMKKVLFIEFSHQLPPGPEKYFPKWTEKIADSSAQVEKILFKHGQLTYIKSDPEAINNEIKNLKSKLPDLQESFKIFSISEDSKGIRNKIKSLWDDRKNPESERKIKILINQDKLQNLEDKNNRNKWIQKEWKKFEKTENSEPNLFVYLKTHIALGNISEKDFEDFKKVMKTNEILKDFGGVEIVWRDAEILTGKKDISEGFALENSAQEPMITEHFKERKEKEKIAAKIEELAKPGETLSLF